MLNLALEAVRSAHALAEICGANRVGAIRVARELGGSWAAIGAAMGMSRQNAHKRFGRRVAESELGEEARPDPAPPTYEHVSMRRLPELDSAEHVAYHVRWRPHRRAGDHLEIISLVRRDRVDAELGIAADV